MIMNAHFRLTVERLASSADVQDQYLRQLGTAPSADELALEFSDALESARGNLPEALREAAAALDRQLDLMSGDANASLWNLDALRVSPEWKKVRELAVGLLGCMD